MKALWDGREDIHTAGNCLLAFRYGEDNIEAEVGAMLIAEALTIFRKVHTGK